MTPGPIAPLVPADADLQDFPFMPLHVARLRDSDLAAEESPEACWYAVLLWAASWHQLPAGSLPDNDRVLMKLVDLGRDERTWKKHKVGALRGFVQCSDGRLYHPVVCEQVKEAWDAKLRQKHRTFCAAVRKHNERNPNNKLQSPTFEEWIGLDRPDNVTATAARLSRGEAANVTRDENDSHTDVVRETPSNRQGQGQGQGDSKEEEAEASPSPRRKRAPEIEIPDWVPAEPWSAFLEMRKRKRATPTPHAADLLIRELEKLRSQGHDPGAVLDQSTRKNWTDVYPLKDNHDGNNRGQANGSPAAGNRSGPRVDGFTAAINADLADAQSRRAAQQAGRPDAGPGPDAGELPVARGAALR